MNNIIKLIDKTLIVLWEKDEKRIRNNISLVKELCILLNSLGCDYVEITPEIYDAIHPLPMEVRFCINTKKSIIIQGGDELDSVLSYTTNNEDIRISGLGDLMFYDEKEKLIKLINTFGNHVELEISNNYCCGTALVNQWLALGGSSIVGTFTGVGGYTPLETVICYLRFLSSVKFRCNTRLIPQILNIYEKLTDERLPSNMPIIGEKIFHVESGIHVDGIMKNPKNYEPYSPEEIGRNRTVIIGKYTGTKALQFKLRELEITLDEVKFKEMLQEVKKESLKQSRGLCDNELYEICKVIGVV